MNALIFHSKEQGLVYDTDFPTPAAQDQVLLEMQAAALNHRDVWITKGMYPGIQPNVVLGSDGVGVYEGKSYIVNPNINWGDKQAHPAKAYTILGMPSHGTFAQYLCVAKDRLHEKPAHLSTAQAAALPLAGLTAYRAVFAKGQLKAGERVFVNGVGGGVALMAAQLAIAVGAEVYVSSSSDEKIEKAIAMGAKAGINYKTADWKAVFADYANSFDLIIDSAGGDAFQNLVKLAAPGARIAIYGGTLGAIPKLSPQVVFWKQLSILGTSMGSDADFEAMLSFVNEHKIVPVVDKVYDLSEGKAAFERMDKGAQFGKIVLSIQ